MNMKNNILVQALAACAIMFLAVACNNKGAKVSGRLVGSDSRTIVLEQVTASGAVSVDSTTTGRKGNFNLKVDLPIYGTAFYNLKIGSDRIPLFISPGERIRITSFYGNPGNYLLQGSHESALVKSLNDMMNAGIARLDSLSRLISAPGNDSVRCKEYLEEYAREYSRLKREQIKFIVANSGSLAALYGLYQRFPNDKTLFNGDKDIIYYRLVADSVAKYYPSSPYLKALRTQIDKVDSNEELARMISESICNPSPYPDISLPDMYGCVRKLSACNGKVILLDFQSLSQSLSALYNAELKELYEEFAPKGFEIYQVGTDTSKQEWIKAVQQQNIPWIAVCDFQGFNGIAPRIYNITSVPSNYLIAGDGEIVARNVPSENLRREVEKLVSKL